jgi:hypothetical protein
MNTVSSNSQSSGLRLGLQPAAAWTAILGFVIFSALGALAGAGSIVRLTFPLGAFAVAVFLYWRYPILYLGFTWWLWFLTPWVRRLIDYRSGFVEPNLVLLAPYLVTLVSLVTFLRYFPKLYRRDGLPFVLALASVSYAIFIGLINSKYGLNPAVVAVIAPGGDSLSYTPSNVLIRALDWAVPILFSFHIYVNWQNYPEYRENLLRTFRWGVLVMGLYGIVQFLLAPEWDKFWLTNVIKTGNTAFGTPVPLGIRVFSTMNSPGPFAITLMAGLILLFADRGIVRLFAAGTGYLTFLLTLVRSAWGSWLLNLIIFSSSLKAHLQMRLLVTVLVVGICAFPLTTIEPFSSVISKRTQTLTNIQEDGSYQARAHAFSRGVDVALSESLGNGVGLPGVDSGFIDILFALGWLGAIPYFSGLLMLVFKVLQGVARRFDPLVSAATAISLGQIAQLIFGNGLTGISGVLIWVFLSFALAGNKYYQHQRSINI